MQDFVHSRDSPFVEGGVFGLQRKAEGEQRLCFGGGIFWDKPLNFQKQWALLRRRFVFSVPQSRLMARGRGASDLWAFMPFSGFLESGRLNGSFLKSADRLIILVGLVGFWVVPRQTLGGGHVVEKPCFGSPLAPLKIGLLGGGSTRHLHG